MTSATEPYERLWQEVPQAMMVVLREFCAVNPGWQANKPWTHPSVVGPAGARIDLWVGLPDARRTPDDISQAAIAVVPQPSVPLKRTRAVTRKLVLDRSELGIVKDGDDVLKEVREIVLPYLLRNALGAK